MARGNTKSAAEVAENIKNAQLKRYQEYSAAGRDIGSIPAVMNKSRRRRAEKSFLKFCETYFGHLFKIKFSASHLQVIAAIENTAKTGGMQAIAMPRGSGKSTMCEVGAIWSILCGHRYFVMLIGATETAAREQLENIKAEMEHNEMLCMDFPEALYPIKKLEGINKRCQGQTANGGDKTNIVWTSNEVSLPTVRGSKVIGATIRVAGITGRIRGTKKTTASGKSIRPDYILLDDIQTEDSSKSTMQCQERLKIINSAVLGLGGAKVKISAMMCCTVISKGDVSDVLLDNKQYPEWHGIRVAMLESEPNNKELWQQYEEVFKESLRVNGNFSEATEFYKSNRKAMDAGAKVYWEERYNNDELSAIQHAINLRIRDVRSFASEYQNQPLSEDYGVTDRQISKEDINEKRNGMARGVVPTCCDVLSIYVDVQKDVLFYAILASDQNFTTSLIEYGSFPDQQLAFWDLNNLRETLSDRYGGSVEGNIYRALKDFVEAKMRQDYMREDGVVLRTNVCLIDANWSESTESVYKFCQESIFANALYPSHGRGVTASSVPMSRYRKRAGERLMHDCIVTSHSAKNRKHVTVDINSWKSFLQSRLITPDGEKGCMTIYGGDRTNHDMLIDHLTAEYFVPTTGQGRTMKEWRVRPNRARNDWFDCIVGALVGLHIAGCQLLEWGDGNSGPAKVVSLATLAETRQKSDNGDSGMYIVENADKPLNGVSVRLGANSRISLRDLRQKKGR